eukprot:404875_1
MGNQQALLQDATTIKGSENFIDPRQKKKNEYVGKRNRTIFIGNDEYVENPQKLDGVDDLSKLTYFEMKNILKNIELRYCNEPNKLYYTSIRDINVLLSINPYNKFSIHDTDMINEFNMYNNSKKGITHILHPYSVAATTFKKMTDTKSNQSIIIRGESGSGKTETMKFIVSYLAHTSILSASINDINDTFSQRMVALLTVLEPFGNAKTLRNDNSTRFGKFIKLFYSITDLENTKNNSYNLGAHLTTYLFEKSRVIQQATHESNFNIFYMLYNVFENKNKINEYDLKSADTFNYLNHPCFISRADGIERFEKLKTSLKILDINDNLQEMIWKIICGILHLGNINFKENRDGYIMIDPNSMPLLEIVCKLLNITTVSLQNRLTTEKLAFSRTTRLRYNKCIKNRDSLAMNIYHRLFLWIIKTANNTFKMDEDCINDDVYFIAILDHIGYQNYCMNSLEQFCINYSNEKLQQFFNNYVCNDEQFGWKPKYMAFDETYFELIENKHDGFFMLLDSSCKAPKPSVEALSQQLFKKHASNVILHKTSEYRSGNCTESTFMVKKKNMFAGILIEHFNDDVTYNLEEFNDKNMDKICSHTLQMMKTSSNTVLKLMGSNKLIKGRKKKSNTGFLNNMLKNILKILKSTDSYFIVCLNSNHAKSESIWNNDVVQRQLMGYGVYESMKTLKYKGLFIYGFFRDTDYKVYIPNEIVLLIKAYIWNTI